MLRSLAQHAEDAGVGRNHIPASCTGAMCCERTPFACQPPPAKPYTVCPRASNAKACCCCCCCASPFGRYPVWTPTRPLLVLYRTRPPSTVLWALSAAASCVVGSACGGPASHHARFVWWSGGGRGKRAKKGTSKCTSSYPYPASFARLKHSSQSLPRITHQVLCLFLGGGRPQTVGMLYAHDR